MKRLFWIIRITFSIGLIISFVSMISTIKSYHLSLQKTAPPELGIRFSNEYILYTLGDIASLLLISVFFIVFELIVISYHLKNKEEDTDFSNNTL